MDISYTLRNLIGSAICTLLIAPALTVAAPSFAGPESVAKFHPLCLSILRDWQLDGGALDMQECAYQQRSNEVIKTAEGVYYAKRANGDSGFLAYKPIGSLDNAMDLVLVNDKELANPLTSIYFLGRIPGAALTRDFLTTIEDGGDRCLGGVNAARLISASKLEVDVNATVDQILTFLEDSPSSNTADISLKPDNYQAYACAGIITKTYDLISSEMQYSRVAFTRDESRKQIAANSRCFDNVVVQELTPPRVLDIEQYKDFLQIYHQQCGS